MANRRKPSAEEIELFRRSVGPVRKLGSDRVVPVRRTVSPRPQQPREHLEDNLRDTFSDMFDAGKVTPDDSLFFARPGLQQKLLRRFRRGQLDSGIELDLHGQTVAQSRLLLLEFINDALAHGLRCVRIVHGKGHGSAHDAPILKNRLNNWLRQHHDVLAFSSATRQHGGTGALYVLLRSKREK